MATISTVQGGDLKLDVERISAVYSGRLGCACGCRGNHTSNPRSIRLIAKRIEEAAPYFKVHVCDWGVWVDTDTRAYVAYMDGRVS